MLYISEGIITIQIKKENPERFIILLNRALFGLLKLAVESEEIFQDADLIDHIISLVDLQQALQMDETQLKAAGMFAKTLITPAV